MKTNPVVPYDPDSERGRAVAADLTRVLDELETAVKARKAAAALAVEESSVRAA